MGEVAVEDKLRIFAGQMYAAAGIGMWCFSRERRLFYSTSSNQQEYLAFLELSDCWDYIFQREQGWERPLIVSDSLHMVWIAQDVRGEAGRNYLILIGPVFPSRISLRHIREALEQRESSLQMRRQLLRILSEVPVQSMEALRQYARMLHYSITEEMIAADEIYLQESKPQIPQRELQWEEKTEETVSADRMQETERILLKTVKEGNPDYKKVTREALEGNSVYLSETGDALRDGKNTMLMFEALCNRAAVEGGLSVYLAREMERRKVEEIENCTTTVQLMKLREKMLDDYIRRVREAQKQEQLSGSKSILDACGYIKAHVLETISMEEVAAAVGYTPYYFSKKFYKEMGIRVTDYIKTARVEHAKILLWTSRKSIQEISDMLHFGTRSYFGKVFQEIVGVSPAVYREQTTGKEAGADEVEEGF